MSFDICKTCRNVGYCTFPRNRIIAECDEFEDMETAPEFDWNLTEILTSPIATDDCQQLHRNDT